MVRHSEHSIKFLQLADLLHVFQITFADIRPDKSIIKRRERKKENLMTKLMKALLPINPLIADAITSIIIETLRIQNAQN